MAVSKDTMCGLSFTRCISIDRCMLVKPTSLMIVFGGILMQTVVLLLRIILIVVFYNQYAINCNSDGHSCMFQQ